MRLIDTDPQLRFESSAFRAAPRRSAGRASSGAELRISSSGSAAGPEPVGAQRGLFLRGVAAPCALTGSSSSQRRSPTGSPPDLGAGPPRCLAATRFISGIAVARRGFYGILPHSTGSISLADCLANRTLRNSRRGGRPGPFRGSHGHAPPGHIALEVGDLPQAYFRQARLMKVHFSQEAGQ